VFSIGEKETILKEFEQYNERRERFAADDTDGGEL